jgi:DNA polymerase-4
MEHYAEISGHIRDILLRFTPQVEPLSLDEAFLDVQGCEPLFGPAPEIGRHIKARIKNEMELTASVGVAPNKFHAKLASDHGKPDGLVVVTPEKVSEFLAPLPVGHIWGLGKKAERRLDALDFQAIGHLTEIPEQILVNHFGEMGRHIWQPAHGRDERRVVD